MAFETPAHELSISSLGIYVSDLDQPTKRYLIQGPAFTEPLTRTTLARYVVGEVVEYSIADDPEIELPRTVLSIQSEVRHRNTNDADFRPTVTLPSAVLSLDNRIHVLHQGDEVLDEASQMETLRHMAVIVFGLAGRST